MRKFLSFLFLCFLIPSSAYSGMVSSGTGFFVSNRGHVITNEHVVKGCTEVMVRGAVDRNMARVIAVDKQNDLALLQTEAVPGRIAPISASGARLKVGEPVLVMGYPKEHGISGDYVTVESRILSLDGPMGEDKWIEFTSSAQQGNSGGPLLDSGGNVVGVIVGKAYISRTSVKNQGKAEVRESDVAIALPVLENFLKSNNVYYRKQSMGYSYNSHRLENVAKDYIVNIHCPAE